MQLPVGVCLYLRAIRLLLFFWSCGLILTRSYNDIMHHVFSRVRLCQWVSVTIVIALSSSHTEKRIWVDLLNLLNFMNYNSRKCGQMLEPTEGGKKPKTKPSASPHSRFFPPVCVSVDLCVWPWLDKDNQECLFWLHAVVLTPGTRKTAECQVSCEALVATRAGFLAAV